MTYSNSTTTRLKGQHLTAIERGKIAAWHSEGISNRQIAKRLGVVPQTINNELKRGKLKQVKKINGKCHYFFKYNAEFAQTMPSERKIFSSPYLFGVLYRTV